MKTTSEFFRMQIQISVTEQKLIMGRISNEGAAQGPPVSTSVFYEY